MGDIVYKTANELSSILESRGVILDIDPVPLIQREGHYALINGYKDPFLDKEAMQNHSEDRYIPGTKISDIYALFLFDRGLREKLFPHIVHAEAAVRSAAVDSFCLKYQDANSYLDRSNYTDERWMLFPKQYKGDKHKAYSEGMNGLIKMFKKRLTPSINAPSYISHYLDHYGIVPLWVLQNSLTFGNVKHFYQLLERDVQARTCRVIQENSGSNERLEPQALLNAIETLVDYRNICAHNDRLYCAKPRGRVFGEMIHSLWKILPPDEMQRLITEINAVMHTHPMLLKNGIVFQVAASMGAIMIPH